MSNGFTVSLPLSQLHKLRETLTREIYELMENVQVPSLTKRVKEALLLGEQIDPKFLSRKSGWGVLHGYLWCYRQPRGNKRITLSEQAKELIRVFNVQRAIKDTHSLICCIQSALATRPKWRRIFKNGDLHELPIEALNYLAEVLEFHEQDDQVTISYPVEEEYNRAWQLLKVLAKEHGVEKARSKSTFYQVAEKYRDTSTGDLWDLTFC
uniref:Uncharacterized protein n=1 Tax=Cyanothece sp. (strain PCC 7425 / ATCC 29141) TaxID=395961 RepID=B8HJL6_CYAP4